MPPGRPPNLDKRIADLIAQLTAAIVAREQQRIGKAASEQVHALVAGLRKTAGASKLLPVGPGVSAGGGSGSGKGNRKPRSEASKAAQREKMKTYWKARKAAEAKGGKPKKDKKDGPAAGGEAAKE